MSPVGSLSFPPNVKVRVVFPVLVLLLAMVQITTVCAGEAEPGEAASSPDGRLGFGFAPGLVAGRDYVAGQLIVGVDAADPITSARAIANLAQRLGGNIGSEIPGSAVLLDFPTENAALKAVDALLALRAVSFIERSGWMGIPPMPAPPGYRKGRPQP